MNNQPPQRFIVEKCYSHYHNLYWYIPLAGYITGEDSSLRGGTTDYIFQTIMFPRRPFYLPKNTTFYNTFEEANTVAYSLNNPQEV